VKDEPLKVASISNDKHLEFVWKFKPSVKKHGELRLIEQLSPEGYSAKLVNEKGNEVTDKDIWDRVHEALDSHKTGRKMI
jgi:hypothetical protein